MTCVNLLIPWWIKKEWHDWCRSVGHKTSLKTGERHFSALSFVFGPQNSLKGTMKYAIHRAIYVGKVSYDRRPFRNSFVTFPTAIFNFHSFWKMGVSHAVSKSGVTVTRKIPYLVIKELQINSVLLRDYRATAMNHWKYDAKWSVDVTYARRRIEVFSKNSPWL